MGPTLGQLLCGVWPPRPFTFLTSLTFTGAHHDPTHHFPRCRRRPDGPQHRRVRRRSPQGQHGCAVAASDKVHCYGVHTCKGNSDCKTAEHSCKGQNACGGHGFKAMDAKSCLNKGGTIGDINAK